MNKLKWILIAVICTIFAAVFIIRAVYKPEPIDTENITVSGLSDGIGVRVGEEIGDIFLSIPERLKAEELVSVTTDGNIAILKLQKSSEFGDRIIRASVIGKGVGVAEVYVMSPDRKTVSERFTVNVYADDKADVSKVPNEVTTEYFENPVYVTPSGKKYHLSMKCAGDTSTPIELTDAVANGYLPCKSCAVKK